MTDLLLLIRTIPPGRLAGKAASKVLRAARTRWEAWQAHLSRGEMGDAELLSALGSRFGSLPNFIRHLKERKKPVLFFPRDAAFVASWASEYPRAIPALLKETEDIRRHRFSWGGSRDLELGDPIDWHRDAESGYRWNPHTYFKLVRETGRDGADILFPWWLNSFYHFIPLGKAYLLGRHRANGMTPEETDGYAREFVSQTESWATGNPYPFGINWRSTTIVAIRLVHWIWAWFLFKDCPWIPDRFWVEYFKQILRHTRHIRRNLEWFPVRTNHYLANLAGLFFSGVLFPEFTEAEAWRNFSRDELVREMDHQTHPDGVHHEGSLNYHRFAAEIFLATAMLGRSNGLSFPDPHWKRIEGMLECILYVLRPDGELPRVGDAADIRLQHLDSRHVIADPSHLLALGAILFKRADFRDAAGGFPEYAFWSTGPADLREYRHLPPSTRAVASRSFPEGGLHVIRNGKEAYLLVRCGPLGLRGVAGHWHYDQLGFELFVQGEPVLIDPGWYRYQADPEMFRYFKSTRGHNTVMVDERDQVAFDLFAYPPPKRPTPRLLKWEETGSDVLFTGEHALYGDLPNPVLHRRELRFLGRDRTVKIRDHLEGSGTHRLEWRFHFDPHLSLTLKENRAIFSGDQIRGTLENSGGEGLLPSLENGWAAPRYGVKVGAPIVRWQKQTTLPFTLESTLRWTDLRSLAAFDS